MAGFTGFGLYRVDEDRRLVLPRRMEVYLKWFKAKAQQECLAVPRRHCIVILPPAALIAHRETMALLETDKEPRFEDLGLPAHEMMRGARFAWPLTIEASRRLLLPKEACELGILPSAPAAVALIAVRQALEVWHPDHISRQLEESVERWGELKAQALRGLHVPEPEEEEPES